MKTETHPVFIDGDFDSGKGDCQHHCSPTCHPGQIDIDDWHYGCRHIAWPSNKARDFVPFVVCGGDKGKCDLKDTKFYGYYKRGLKARLNNCNKKLDKLWQETRELMNG